MQIQKKKNGGGGSAGWDLKGGGVRVDENEELNLL